MVKLLNIFSGYKYIGYMYQTYTHTHTLSLSLTHTHTHTHTPSCLLSFNLIYFFKLYIEPRGKVKSSIADSTLAFNFISIQLLNIFLLLIFFFTCSFDVCLLHLYPLGPNLNCWLNQLVKNNYMSCTLDQYN